MAINPYILGNLYDKGIIDYVPDGLGEAQYANVSGANYFNSASSGQMFKNYANQNDTFVSSNLNSGNIYNSNTQNSSAINNYTGDANINGLTSANNLTNPGMNAFGFNGVGGNSTAGMDGFGFNGIGDNSTAGMDGFGDPNIGNKVSNVYNRTPNFVKGLISGAFVVGTLILMFKKKKKPSNKEAKSFFSRLNPFKKSAKDIKKGVVDTVAKTKETVVEAGTKVNDAKKGFFSKIKSKFRKNK